MKNCYKCQFEQGEHSQECPDYEEQKFGDMEKDKIIEEKEMIKLNDKQFLDIRNKVGNIGGFYPSIGLIAVIANEIIPQALATQREEMRKKIAEMLIKAMSGKLTIVKSDFSELVDYLKLWEKNS